MSQTLESYPCLAAAFSDGFERNADGLSIRPHEFEYGNHMVQFHSVFEPDTKNWAERGALASAVDAKAHLTEDLALIFTFTPFHLLYLLKRDCGRQYRLLNWFLPPK